MNDAISMYMRSHTPGPWWIDSEDNRVLGGERTVVCHTGNQKNPTIFADALLIAAAPDMLAALQGLVGDEDDGAYFSLRVKKAKAAIAKATGGQA